MTGERLKNIFAVYHLSILTVLFIVVNAFLYYHNGVKVMSDSVRYLEWAENLWTGQLSVYQWRFWYISYVIFLSAFITTGTGTVVMIQIAISYVACLAVYFLALRLSDNRMTSFLASSFFLLWYEIPAWNTYLLTESLFTSMIVISLWLIVRFGSRKTISLLIILVLFTMLIRPMGVTVLIAFGFYFYHYSGLAKHLSGLRKMLFISAGGALLFIFLFFLLEGNPDVHFYYAKGQVVWGADQMESLKNNPWLVVDNSQVIYPDKNLSSMAKFIEFSVTNFSFQAELFFRKLIMFVIHVKPYYSFWHNLFIVLTLIPVYGFAIYGLKVSDRNPEVKYFTISLFISNALMTGLTVEAWDGRFLIPVLPLLMIYCSVGLRKFIGRQSFFLV